MTKITRATQKEFGSSGPTGEFGVFGSLYSASPTNSKDPATIQSLSNFLYGWNQAVVGGRKPPLEDMNSLFLLAFRQIAYVLQEGVAEWDSGTEYHQYSYAKKNGIMYVSLQNTNTNKDPETQPTWWGYPEGALPTGAQVSYGGSTAPSGFLLCNGAEVSRSTYSRLFAVIGTAYGVGNGSTTFNVPNKAGKVSVGLNASDSDFNARGKTGGAKTHTLTTSEMPAHTHSKGTNLGANGSGVGELEGSYGGGHVILDSGNTGSAGGGSAHNNLQPYETDNWIIKT